MISPRIKPDDTDTFMHLYNRIAGSRKDLPFGEVEKDEFLKEMDRLLKFYVIEVLSHQVMGNHFHLVLHIPCKPPSAKEAAKRYKAYYNGTRSIKNDPEKCLEMAERMRDISWFMRDLQQHFSCWFNRTRKERRRGHLWGGRFCNSILESGQAVWDCLKYVEMNPVRAGMVESPADYRFCSFGKWSGKIFHPHHKSIKKLLLPMLDPALQISNMRDLKRHLKEEFEEEAFEFSGEYPGEKQTFSNSLHRHMRYWGDGLVIGSEAFILNTLAKSKTYYNPKTRRLTRMLTPTKRAPANPIYAFRQLRVRLE